MRIACVAELHLLRQQSFTHTRVWNANAEIAVTYRHLGVDLTRILVLRFAQDAHVPAMGLQALAWHDVVIWKNVPHRDWRRYNNSVCISHPLTRHILERDSMVYCSRCNGRSTFVLLTVHLQLCKQGFTPVSRIEISAAASASA